MPPRLISVMMHVNSHVNCKRPELMSSVNPVFWKVRTRVGISRSRKDLTITRSNRSRRLPSRDVGPIELRFDQEPTVEHSSIESGCHRCRLVLLLGRLLRLPLLCRLAPDSAGGRLGRCGPIRGLWLSPCG